MKVPIFTHAWHPKNDPIYFGSGVELVVQAGPMYFSHPRIHSFSMYDYQRMQFSIKIDDETISLDECDEPVLQNIPLSEDSQRFETWINRMMPVQAQASVQEGQDVFDFFKGKIWP